MRGKDYDLLDLEAVQARLAQLPDQQMTHPETGTSRILFDFPDLALAPAGPRSRVIVAARSATDGPVKVGTTRGEMVYELFYTALPQGAFTPTDVVDLYLHRGGFECVLADLHQRARRRSVVFAHCLGPGVLANPCSMDLERTAQELGHALHPTPMRTTEFAPAA